MENTWLGAQYTAWGGSPDFGVADMYLGSHFMTGVAILEQSNDSLVGDSGHVCLGGDDANGSYICY